MMATNSTPQKTSRRTILLRWLAFLAVVAISVFVFSIRERADELAKYGYAGVFLLSVLSNATVILPAPSNLFVFAMGAVLNPFGIALAAGVGAALGELSGYMAGYSGRAIVERVNIYEHIRRWMEANRRWSFLAIIGLSAFPNPLFDLAGIAAGTLRIPVWIFLICCIIGKTINMSLFAFAGSGSIQWFIK